MKIRIISTLLLSLICLTSYAYEGKNFRIISEKVSKSPNFQGGFIDNQKKILFKPMYMNVISWAYNAEGRTYEYVKIQGDHTISLSNDTSQTKRYKYTYALSCENAFENFEREIEIYPHGSFNDNGHSFGTVQKESSGTFGIHVMTKVTGAENGTHTSDAILRIIN